MIKCGLLGRKLGHSYSPQIHEMMADYEYKLYEMEEEEVGPFLLSRKLNSMNVTIPYKKTVLPYMDELSDTARTVGSVNTIVLREDGTYYGDNTDVYGFISLVRDAGMDPSGKKTLVLGSGGASVSVRAALEILGAQVVIISRSGEDNYTNLERHADAKMIVNTTPVGMFPKNGESPIDLRKFPLCEGVIDIIYNPARTALLLQAEELGIPNANGLHMLVAQAKRSSEQFQSAPIEDRRIVEITRKLDHDMENIVLVGMPGCGKTTIAKALSDMTGRPILDADAAIVEMAGMSIPEIFAQQGEEGFRKIETQVLEELGKRSGVIISTGGGCVTRGVNYPLLHQNGVIFWIQRDVEQLDREGRPLSTGNLSDMYAKRAPLYSLFADHTIENNGSVEEAAMKIYLQTL